MEIYKSEWAVYHYQVFSTLKNIFDVIYDWTNTETGESYKKYYLKDGLYFRISGNVDNVNVRVSVFWEYSVGTQAISSYDFTEGYVASIEVFKTESAAFICLYQSADTSDISRTQKPMFIINTVNSGDDVHVLSNLYYDSFQVYGDRGFAGEAPIVAIHGRFSNGHTNVVTTQVAPVYNTKLYNRKYDDLYQILYSEKRGIVVFNGDNWLLTTYFATPAGEITETTIT